MSRRAIAYPVEPRYPICPECRGNLFLPAEHGASVSCPDCGLELQLSPPGVEDPPTAYYVSTLRRQKRRKPPPRIDGPADVHRLLRPLLQDADR